jgi:hypothetical protein
MAPEPALACATPSAAALLSWLRRCCSEALVLLQRMYGRRRGDLGWRQGEPGARAGRPAAAATSDKRLACEGTAKNLPFRLAGGESCWLQITGAAEPELDLPIVRDPS